MVKKLFSLSLLAGSTALAVMIFVQKSPEKMIVNDGQANLIAIRENISPETVPDITGQATSPAVQGIGEDIAAEIIAQNPEGPETSDDGHLITAPDPKKIAEKIIAERFAQSSFPLLAPEIDMSQIKIVPGNDPALVDGYLNNTKTISEKNFAGISINFDDPDIEDFKKLAAAYEKTIQEYYSLNVPSSLVDFHKEKIKLFTQQKKIFFNISNIEKDPLAALISMRLIGQAHNDLTNLNARIAQFAKKYNL
ncbi:MAG: hypothetical protein AAB345_02280 [Patescibacteria group bacterium]